MNRQTRNQGRGAGTGMSLPDVAAEEADQRPPRARELHLPGEKNGRHGLSRNAEPRDALPWGVKQGGTARWSRRCARAAGRKVAVGRVEDEARRVRGAHGRQLVDAHALGVARRARPVRECACVRVGVRVCACAHVRRVRVCVCARVCSCDAVWSHVYMMKAGRRRSEGWARPGCRRHSAAARRTRAGGRPRRRTPTELGRRGVAVAHRRLVFGRGGGARLGLSEHDHHLEPQALAEHLATLGSFASSTKNGSISAWLTS